MWAGAPAWVWGLGLVLAVVILGPGLGPGALMNLDLLLFEQTPLASGVWGLGPELPRRLPLWVPIAWAGSLGLGAAVGKAIVVVALVGGFVGTHRLSTAVLVGRPGASYPARSVAIAATASGVIYAAGPFVLTRVAVGHWPVVVTMALLPWALPDLFGREASLRRIGLWAVLFGLGGVYGATIGGVVLLAGFLGAPAGQIARRSVVWVAGQTSWLVSMAVVATLTLDRSMAPAEAFASRIDDVGDLGRLFAGLGFWNTGFQLGLTQPGLAAVCGAVFVVLAVVGAWWLPPAWRGRCLAVAAFSLALAAVTTVPGIDEAFTRFTDTLLGAPFREPQRNLAPLLLVVALCAPLGALRISTRLPGVLGGPLEVLPLLLAVVLVAPSLWGLEGQLRPVDLPGEWDAARDLVDDEPGTVLALPWFQYFTADVADNRLVLMPLPAYLGGDVIAASDPEIGDRAVQEVGDPREAVAGDIVAAARQGRPVSDELAALGVRWVALLHDVDWRLYTGVIDDPGLEERVGGDSITLYEVDGWRGPVTDTEGAVVDTTPLLSPLLDVEASGPATYAAPFQRGWARGWHLAERDTTGQIALPGGSGPVWYWPSLLVVAGYVVWLALVAWLLWPLRAQLPRAAGAGADARSGSGGA